MATLNISRYEYKGLLIITKLIWITHFIHSFWEPNNLSNLSPWYLFWLSPLFQVFDITAFIQGVNLLYIYCEGELRPSILLLDGVEGEVQKYFSKTWIFYFPIDVCLVARSKTEKMLAYLYIWCWLISSIIFFKFLETMSCWEDFNLEMSSLIFQ